MKKNFFYFAFAAVAAISLTACSSDDDSNDSGSSTPTVNLPKPVNADNAAVYTLTGGGIASTTPAGESASTHVLASLEVTESEQVLFQVTESDNTPFYVIDRPTSVVGNLFTFNSNKAKGTIQRVESAPATTRQGLVEYAIILNIQLYHNGTWVEFKTAPEGAPATKQTQTPSTDDVTTWLVRTWSFVTGNLPAATFDVHLASNGVTAFKDFFSTNGTLDLETTILKEAVEVRNVGLSAKDKDDLKRNIKNITVSADKFVIAYADGRGDDVAKWSWTDNYKTTMKIQLMDNKMGNKFFNNDTKIDVAFNDNRCNLTLKVLFTDDNGKQWDSSLTVHMQYATVQ